MRAFAVRGRGSADGSPFTIIVDDGSRRFDLHGGEGRAWSVDPDLDWSDPWNPWWSTSRERSATIRESW